MCKSPTLRSHLVICIFLAILLTAPAMLQAQSSPKGQIFGGYSYLRFDSTRIGFADVSNMNGWNFSPAYNFTKHFGIALDASGHYGNHQKIYTFMSAGERDLFRAPAVREIRRQGQPGLSQQQQPARDRAWYRVRSQFFVKSGVSRGASRLPEHAVVWNQPGQRACLDWRGFPLGSKKEVICEPEVEQLRIPSSEGTH
jgi:hypothetical protein